jgi:hypothetical protein
MNPLYKDNDFSDRLVAFLDILGFRKLVLSNKSIALQTINIIDGHINHILNVLKENNEKTFSTKLFSDCICISCEYSLENIFYIIYELAFIQLYFSFEGIFLRGALSRGNHFENDRMIFSHGLIKAYELEQIAIYPRIIIDKELIDHIKHDSNSYYAIYIGFKTQDFIIKSPDGHFFVDYLNLLYEEGLEQIESLKTHKQAILTNVQQNIENIRVIEKYHWLAGYHNFKFNEIFNADDYEPSDADEIIKETSINLKSSFPQFKKSLMNDYSHESNSK